MELIRLTENTNMKINCQICGIKYKNCDCFVKYANFKNDLIEQMFTL